MSRLLKIGLVCPYNLFRGGGVQEHVLAQAEHLRLRGHKVKIITPRPRKYTDDEPDDMIFIGTSTTFKLPISTSLELGGNFKRDNIDEMLEAESFDLLHIHEPEVPMLGSQIIAKATCPVVATFHASHPNNAAGKTIHRMRVPYSRSIFAKLSAVTAVSEVAAEFVTEHVDKNSYKVHIVPNGIDLDKYNPAKKRTPGTIVYVGRLEKRKGVIYLLKAFAKLQETVPEARLQIVGEGPERSRLENKVYELDLQNVEFLGFVSDERKKEILNEAYVFCSPALFGESFGIVLLEAMAYCLPTVAGNNPGYDGLMKDTGQLSIVNPKNTDDFARRLKLFLENEEIRDIWVKWAVEYSKQFDYKKVISAYESIYMSLLD